VAEPVDDDDECTDLGRKAVIGAIVGFVVIPIVGRLVKWGLDETTLQFLRDQSDLVFKVLGAVGFVYGVFSVWEWASWRFRRSRQRSAGA
jgi:hypothetical protein